jgi:hypothetical protein
VIDRHLLGDERPYAFVTHDWGAHWTAIATGLPAGESARAIRADTRNPHLVYLGLENSFWLSYDDGAHWRKPALSLPTVATYDLRIQPRFNDLIAATHGRALWVLDDLTPIQELPQAEAAGAMLFTPRTAYLFNLHANDEGLYTRYAGKNPANGAMLTFYQAHPGAQAPTIEILDAAGHVVRHIAGTQLVGEHEVPLVPNDAGLNRVEWDLHEDGPVRWMSAAKDRYRGPRSGVTVLPGTYTARVALNGKTFTQSFLVASDPRVQLTPAEYRSAYGFTKKHLAEYSQLDGALNRLDAYAASAAERGKSASGELATTLAAVRTKALALRGRMTADFSNDEDFIQRPGRIREDLQGTLSTGGAPPTAAQLDYAARVDAEYTGAMRDVAAFERTDVVNANTALKAAGKPVLATSGAKRADVVTNEAATHDED